jgi:hypothetical protein
MQQLANRVFHPVDGGQVGGSDCDPGFDAAREARRGGEVRNVIEAEAGGDRPDYRFVNPDFDVRMADIEFAGRAEAGAEVAKVVNIGARQQSCGRSVGNRAIEVCLAKEAPIDWVARPLLAKTFAGLCLRASKVGTKANIQ